MNYLSEKKIQKAFLVSLWLKGVHAFFETVGGVLLFVVSPSFLAYIIEKLTNEELTEDPGSFISNYLVHSTSNLSGTAQSFAAWYLLIHGVVKGVLIIGLLKGKLFAYPIAIAVFAIFVAYQLGRFGQTHSLFLIAITIIDLVVILLTWHEYKHKKHMLKKGEFL